MDECHACGFDLSEGDFEAVDPSGQAKVAAYTLARVLRQKEVPADANWPYSTAELFRTLFFIFRLLKAKERRHPSSKNPSENRRRVQGGILSNEREAFVLVGKAWSLLQDYPSRLELFLRENLFLFDVVS